jgi:hypothetical protein
MYRFRIDEQGQLIDGRHRLEALRQAGVDAIPIEAVAIIGPNGELTGKARQDAIDRLFVNPALPAA